jgi:hypothetical protein
MMAVDKQGPPIVWWGDYRGSYAAKRADPPSTTCSVGMTESGCRVIGCEQNRDNLRLIFLTGRLKRIGVLQVVVTERRDQKECPGV